MLTIIHPGRMAGAIIESLNIIWKRRLLIIELARRELKEQYIGQVLGIFWSVLHPIFLMALFVFLFGYVFGVRLGDAGARAPADYAVYILSGLVPWLGCQQIMTRSCGVMRGHANMVKQVVFPIEVLPIKTVLVGMFTQMVSLFALFAYYFIAHGLPPASFLMLPFLLFFQVLAMFGIAFAFAAVAVFLRDLKDVVQVFSTWGMYLAPIVYLVEWLPETVRPVVYLNPFSYMVWAYQDVIYHGEVMSIPIWAVFCCGSMFVFVAGYRVFRRLKPFMGDRL